MRNDMTSCCQNIRRTGWRSVLMSECCGITRPHIDGSLARDEDGGRRRQGDEQDRIEGSTAHDPADGYDSFSFESLIFPVLFAHAAEHRTSKPRRGYGRRP